MLFAFLLFGLAAAAPFVTTWRIIFDNERVELPAIEAESNLTINWGDLTAAEFFPSGYGVATHTYASPNNYTVSIDGQFSWEPFFTRQSTATTQMIDIVSWGDGIKGRRLMCAGFPDLQVSAPPNTQPVLPPNSDLYGFFLKTAFNSSLDWDLLNVTDISFMFWRTPLNQPITFRNTQGVQRMEALFLDANQFNQPFHFDASGVTTTASMFSSASSFNSILNLSNSSQLVDTFAMFASAISFNQPITFNISSVYRMSSMFSNASSFNQPINFSSPLQLADYMFDSAVSFNQVVVLETSSVTSMKSMFSGATSFASTVNFTWTSNVIDMTDMFNYAYQFTQDLSGWDTRAVTQCNNFCPYCVLPPLSSCSPCPTRLDTRRGKVCLYSPSPTTPSTAAPSTAAPSAAPSVAPSSAPDPAALSPAAAAVPSLACGLLLLLALGFRL